MFFSPVTDKSSPEETSAMPLDEVKTTPTRKTAPPARNSMLTSFFAPKPKKKSKAPIEDKDEQQQPAKTAPKKKSKAVAIDVCGCGRDWVQCQFDKMLGESSSSLCTPQPINNV